MDIKRAVGIKGRQKIIALALGPLIFAFTLLFVHPEGMSPEANAVLACTLWIAFWWITEAIPIAVTSLLPIILFPLSGAMDISTTTAAYGHRFVFLFLGGFILAIAIERWNLHKRIALNIIRLIGTNVKLIILGFMVATAFLSMWISNTATSVMILPIGIAIITQLKDNPDTLENETRIFGKALMLAIAYSASIGGVGTLIGTPPNLVLAGILQELYQVEVTFLSWMKFGVPISVVLLFICWKYLTEIRFTFVQKSFPGGRAEIYRQLRALGKINYEEKIVLVVFVCTALAWILRSLVLDRLIPGIDDTIIALAAGVSLFILPARKGANRRLLNWEEAVNLPWGILLLFGGGMALATGFQESGLAEWIGTQINVLEGAPLLVLLLVLVFAVNFLTEITSNLATAAMCLPILAAVSIALDVHPYTLMVGVTVAASCAFMLPVATPPNAVVFGSGYLRISDMVRSGVWMNLISVILVTLATYFLLPYLWEFNAFFFPEELK
jgi:sodium-dependent dicarboxylate transporter 2/3/5